jgi:hypothetical protein
MSPRSTADLTNSPQLGGFHLGWLKFAHVALRSFESSTTVSIYLVAMEEIYLLNGKIDATVAGRATSHGASSIIGSDSTFA